MERKITINSFKYQTSSYDLTLYDGSFSLSIKYDKEYLSLKGDKCLLNDLVDELFKRNLQLDNNNYESDLEKEFNRIYNEKYRHLSRAIFAGGCFWCMAHPYYTIDGVIDVISGYAGGADINPTYESTKHGNGHRETVLIIYDSTIVNYSYLLHVYFESIDPFDEEGQFIDKGFSYTTAVFTSNKDEINDFYKEKEDIDNLYQMETKVKLLPESTFFIAEDYHQRFEFKNKEKFEKEEEISGRNEYMKKKKKI